MNLFVYGTLRRDGSNAWRMEEAEFVSAAVTPGRLFRVDWYPAACFEAGSLSSVHGELYRASHELLKRLDIFEGAEYERVEIDVTTPAGTQRAYAWSFLPSIEGLKELSHGDWMLEIENNA